MWPESENEKHFLAAQSGGVYSAASEHALLVSYIEAMPGFFLIGMACRKSMLAQQVSTSGRHHRSLSSLNRTMHWLRISDYASSLPSSADPGPELPRRPLFVPPIKDE